MVAAAPNVGTGIAITFSSGFFAFIRDVSGSGQARDAIDTSNNSISDSYKTFVPSDLTDPGAW